MHLLTEVPFRKVGVYRMICQIQGVFPATLQGDTDVRYFSKFRIIFLSRISGLRGTNLLWLLYFQERHRPKDLLRASCRTAVRMKAHVWLCTNVITEPHDQQAGLGQVSQTSALTCPCSELLVRVSRSLFSLVFCSQYSQITLWLLFRVRRTTWAL